MSVFVKICGLSEPRHVAAAVEAGANAVGFVFAESVRNVAPDVARAVSAGVPKHIKRVAVMLHPTNRLWQEVLETFEPDVLQTDSIDFDALEVPASVERWPVFREGSTMPEVTGTYIYEGPKSGQGETVDWSRAAELAGSGQMILAGGLSADNVAEAILTVRPFGVDVSSAVEASPGRKDSQRIADFIRAVRAAENNL